MRTTILLSFLLCAALQGLAQSHGITYQAIILSRPDDITEIPGVDVPGGNYLPDQALEMRFTILDQSGAIEYQETHGTTTDRYGLVSVIIGHGSMTNASPDVFEEIDWDGTPKDLRVEVNIPPPSGYGEYLEFSMQKLVFAPYAFHRNITATGTMIIDGATTLNNSLLVANGSPTWLTGTLTVDSCLYLHDCLVVDGTTDLNNGLDVNLGTPTDLSGTLNVDGAATLNSSLDVDGATTLNYTLDVDGASTLNSTLDVDGGTTLNSTLDVDGATTLNNTLDVDGPSTLNNTLDVDGATTLNSTLDVDGTSLLHSTLDVLGQTTITTSVTGDEGDFDAYPLRVEGSQHGLALKVNATEMDGTTNFITFFDGDGNAVGAVEGQSSSDLHSDPEFLYETAKLAVELGVAVAENGAAALSSTACVGIGACVTAPMPSWNVLAWFKMGVALANITAYEIFAHANLGVTYESGSADYAEWLERADHAETMSFGDIVSVKGGKISKDTREAERYMVISLKPAVLGNMPEEGKKDIHEKVGFMGQVPVKVVGPVSVGDYILPSGFNNGVGKGVAPDEMTLEDHARIVGVAWSASEAMAGYVNVAIGLNNNDLVTQMTRQQTEIDELRAELKATQDAVKRLLPDLEVSNTAASAGVRATLVASIPRSLTAEEMHPPIDRAQIEEGLDMLRMQLGTAGVNVDVHPVFGPIFNVPAEREAFVEQILLSAKAQRLRRIEIDRQHGYK